jgi:hypothetical protein
MTDPDAGGFDIAFRVGSLADTRLKAFGRKDIGWAIFLELPPLRMTFVVSSFLACSAAGEAAF